jgi:hypothetical protein
MDVPQATHGMTAMGYPFKRRLFLGIYAIGREASSVREARRDAEPPHKWETRPTQIASPPPINNKEVGWRALPAVPYNTSVP